jgi:glutathione synthase/RimK-type ligase-like ATP-grasp enzyme
MIVSSSRRVRGSGEALERALVAAGYNGPHVNYGASWSTHPGALNSPESIGRAANKRVALETMRAAGVPTLFLPGPIEEVNTWPCVARRDFHQGGRGFFLCHSRRELDRAIRKGATHCQTYLEGAREFRVHVFQGQSIKLSEKIGGGNHRTGATFVHPREFGHRKRLRQAAKGAVLALGLDFGAVDLLWKRVEDPGGYVDVCAVLEVNTAPRLTDATSDTLARYVSALMRVPE